MLGAYTLTRRKGNTWASNGDVSRGGGSTSVMDRHTDRQTEPRHRIVSSENGHQPSANLTELVSRVRGKAG